MNAYGGSVTQVMLAFRRRERQFEREDWKHPRLMPLPEHSREGVRRVLGFFIGEEPADPFRLEVWPCPAVASPYPAAVIGTGPP